MKIITWNVNGIRATNRTNSIKDLLDSLQADIICLQETKITRNLLTTDIGNVDGYLAFFSFSRKKSGYSGVVTYCKKSVCPINAEEGLTELLTNKERENLVGHYPHLQDDSTDDELLDLDSEGRVVITEHEMENEKPVCIVNVYCPMALTENKERYSFKMRFYKLLEARCRSLHGAGKHVILVGDLNVCHRRIDNCDPGEDFDKSISRKWLCGILKRMNLSVPAARMISARYLEKEAIEQNESANETRSHEQESSNYRGMKNNSKEAIEQNESSNEPGSHEDEFGNYRGTQNNFQEPIEQSESSNEPSPQEDECANYRGTKNDSLFLVDLFRAFHPIQQDAFTAWSTKVRARETNYGSRIDYILSTPDLAVTAFEDCQVRPDIYGSDHCPVECMLTASFKQAATVPRACATFMAELSGKQQDIKSYFKKSSASSENLKRQPDSEVCSQDNKRRKLETENVKIKRSNSLFSYFGGGKGDGKPPIKGAGKKTETEKTSLTSLDDDFENLSKIQKEKKRNINNNTNSTKWKNILKGPAPPPLCSGHNESCVMHTVKKEGPNLGRQFFCCARPSGHATNKEARCKFFIWKK